MAHPWVTLTAIIAAEPFSSSLQARAVAEAIGAGVADRGLPMPEVQLGGPGVRLGGPKAYPELVERIRASRAVVVATPRLDEHTLLGSVPFAIATTARQGGIPCYAVTRENALTLFDARMLDLQVVIEARSRAALRAAGSRLAEIL